jgi:hypothetical protein
MLFCVLCVFSAPLRLNFLTSIFNRKGSLKFRKERKRLQQSNSATEPLFLVRQNLICKIHQLDNQLINNYPFLWCFFPQLQEYVHL